MSDLQIVEDMAQNIERLLEQKFHASGVDIRAKTVSVQSQLPDDIQAKLAQLEQLLARVRTNPAGALDAVNDFKLTANEVEAWLLRAKIDQAESDKTAPLARPKTPLKFGDKEIWLLALGALAFVLIVASLS